MTWQSKIQHIKEILYNQPVNTAWVSGSIVENLGNNSSDIDVFVVGYEKDLNTLTLYDDSSKPHFSNVGVTQFDVWTMANIHRLSVRLESLPLGQCSKLVLEKISENEIEFIHRLRIGKVIHNEGAFNYLYDQFSFQRLAIYLAENEKINVDDAFDDTVGMFEIGELPSAAIRARFTAESVLSLLLFTRGITNHKIKHRERLLCREAKKDNLIREAHSRYWDNVVSIPREESDLEHYVYSVLGFVEEIMNEIDHQ